MSDKQYRAQKAQEMTGSIADQTAWIIDDDGGITAMYDTGMDNETRYAVIAYVLAGDVLSLSAESANLRADLAAAQEQLENEKFERWQEDQQRNILQQEVSELHALNLYDLVGDPDPLRAEMVSTIRERDELRKGLAAARKQTGIAIARAEYDKAGLRAELAAARTTLAIVQGREIKLSLTLGHVYLALTRLAAEPQTDTAAIVEMMTTIEAVMPGDGNNGSA